MQNIPTNSLEKCEELMWKYDISSSIRVMSIGELTKSLPLIEIPYFAANFEQKVLVAEINTKPEYDLNEFIVIFIESIDIAVICVKSNDGEDLILKGIANVKSFFNYIGIDVDLEGL